MKLYSFLTLRYTSPLFSFMYDVLSLWAMLIAVKWVVAKWAFIMLSFNRFKFLTAWSYIHWRQVRLPLTSMVQDQGLTYGWSKQIWGFFSGTCMTDSLVIRHERLQSLLSSSGLVQLRTHLLRDCFEVSLLVWVEARLSFHANWWLLWKMPLRKIYMGHRDADLLGIIGIPPTHFI